MIFENRILRRIFEPKREDVEGGCRTLHNEELHNLYASPKYYSGDQMKEDEIGGTCSTHGTADKCIQRFGRKTQRDEITRKT
jgi:hypothetical protein